MTEPLGMLVEEAANLIPVTLLTGFLGSGKTTLLNHLVKQPEMADSLVIINEFGEMALDHALVAHSTENLVMEMSSGCVCCNIRGDLVKTLGDITWRFSRNGNRWFRRVLIETTGLADPAPIIQTLMTHPLVSKKYRLDGVITTVDLATGMETLNRHLEAIKQAAVADALLLTKADLATEEQHTALLHRLKQVNPAAPCWEIENGNITAENILNFGLYNMDSKAPDVLRWLKEEAYVEPTSHEHDPEQNACDHGTHNHSGHHSHGHHPHDVNRHDDNIRAFCFTLDQPISEASLAKWLNMLMQFIGSRILRVKGILNVEDNERPVVVHGVQHIFHPPVTLPAWPSEDQRSRLVFITDGVDRDVIENTFREFR